MASLTAPTVSQIRETEMAGERFIHQPDGVLLVASKSEPGTWHRIENAACDCKGFQYRGHCRHIAAALELESSTTTDTSVTVEITTEQGGGWRVIWHGHQHGGVHHQRSDAEGHAQELREAPAWDVREWRDLHGEWPVPAGRPVLRIVESGR